MCLWGVLFAPPRSCKATQLGRWSAKRRLSHVEAQPTRATPWARSLELLRIPFRNNDHTRIVILAEGICAVHVTSDT